MAQQDLFTKCPAQQPGPKKPGQLTDGELDQFFTEGYVQIDNYFTDDDLQPVIKDLEWLLDRVANKLFAAGKIKELYADANFFERATLLNKEFPNIFILLHKRDHMTKAIRKLWSCDKLLNFNEQILGCDDINGHPNWNIRCKIPHHTEGVVPWHQDHAYFNGKSADVMIPTAWIPLLDTNLRNGCMQVVPKGHASGKIATHTCCVGPTWYVDLDEKEMKTLGVDVADLVTCEVPYGGVLFINNLIPHRSVDNVSNEVRWSLDLRWHKAGTDNAFYSKKSILMRSSTNPDQVIDFGGNIDDDQKKAYHDTNHIEKPWVEEDYSTIITGEWMGKWELVDHNNEHVKAFLEKQKE